MSGKLEGRVAVVTGGNSGIGLATAKRFVAEGAYVFITGRQKALALMPDGASIVMNGLHGVHEGRWLGAVLSGLPAPAAPPGGEADMRVTTILNAFLIGATIVMTQTAAGA